MFSMKHKYFEEEKGDEDGKGGGGGDDKTTTYTKEQYDGLQLQINAMQTKNSELLDEVKTSKKAKREAQEATEKAKNKKSQEAGDFEELYKSSQQKNGELQTQLNDSIAGIATEKKNNAAMKIAGNLADGENISLLSEFISRRLRYNDGGVKVLNGDGELTVSTLKELETEFQNNKRFASLLKGNQSNGGGANGGKGGGATGKTMSRGDFEALSVVAKAKFVKDKGALTD